MNKLNQNLIAAALAAAIATLPATALADTAEYAEQDRGFAWGAVIGGLAGGPLGAIIGAAGGSKIGEGAGMKADLENTRRQLAEAQEAAATAQARVEQLEQPQGEFAVFAGERDVLDDALFGLAGGLTITYPFRTGSDRIEPHVASQAARLGQALAHMPQLSVHIEGFADIRGSDTANQALSNRRADAVAAALAEAGVAPERINVKAHGERQAFAASGDGEGWFFDRRVVVTLAMEE